MIEESGHLRLNDGQKSRLLGFALEADPPAAPPDENEERGNLLCDLLRGPLPAHGVPCHAGVPAAHSSDGGLRPVLGPSIRELLLNAKTGVEVLTNIKEYAKVGGTHAASEREKDVFFALYFAAIAAACVYHDEVITEHSYQNLEGFFDSFAKSSWVPSEIADLLRRAGDLCRTRGEDQKDLD